MKGWKAIRILMEYLIYIRREYQVAYYKNILLNITYIIKPELSLQLPQFDRYNFNKIARRPVKK